MPFGFLNFYSSSEAAGLLDLLIPREGPGPASLTGRLSLGSGSLVAETTAGGALTGAGGRPATCFCGLSVSKRVTTLIFSSYSSRRSSIPALFKTDRNPSSSVTLFRVCETGLSIHFSGALIFHRVVFEIFPSTLRSGSFFTSSVIVEWVDTLSDPQQ